LCPCGKQAFKTFGKCTDHLACTVLVRKTERAGAAGGASGGAGGGAGGAGGGAGASGGAGAAAGGKTSRALVRYGACGKMTAMRNYACATHCCKRCGTNPIFKTRRLDRADFLKRTRLCKKCSYARGFFHCSVSMGHGIGKYSMIYIPLDRISVAYINEFLGFGINGETTICVNAGYQAKHHASMGVATKCALFCNGCLLSWARSGDSTALRMVTRHPGIITDDTYRRTSLFDDGEEY